MASVDRKLGFLLPPLPSCPLFLLLSTEKFSPCSVFQTLSTLSRSVSLVCSCVLSVSITPLFFFSFLYPLCSPWLFRVPVFSGSYVFLCFFEKKQGNNSPAILVRPFGLFSFSLYVYFLGFPLSLMVFFRVFSSGFSACSSSVSSVFFVSPTWVFFSLPWFFFPFSVPSFSSLFSFWPVLLL